MKQKVFSLITLLSVFQLASGQNDFCSKLDLILGDWKSGFNSFRGEIVNGQINGTARVPGALYETIEEGIFNAQQKDYHIIVFKGTQAQADSVSKLLRDQILSCRFKNFEYLFNTQESGFYRYEFVNNNWMSSDFREGVFTISIWTLPVPIFRPTEYHAKIIIVNR